MKLLFIRRQDDPKMGRGPVHAKKLDDKENKQRECKRLRREAPGRAGVGAPREQTDTGKIEVKEAIERIRKRAAKRSGGTH
jgi:hypothetical protein